MDNRRNNRRDNRDQNKEEKQFEERVVSIDRVARVVKGGRRFRFRALVVLGDKKGKIGIGIAKGADVTSAVTKAVDSAKKTMIDVAIHEGTIPHEAQSKVGGANILIKPASPGTGLIAGGVVRTILEVAGVSNALSKSLGSSNKVNTAYATIAALKTLVPKSEWVMQPFKTKAKAPKQAAKAPVELDKKVSAKPTEKVVAKKTTTKASKVKETAKIVKPAKEKK